MNKKDFVLSLLGCFALAITGCNKKNKNDTTSNFRENNSDYFTITWANEDGTILEIDQYVLKGSIPSYDGETPTKAEDEHYTYTWSGWNNEIHEADKNETYFATFSSEKIIYTIDFDLNGGNSNSYNGPKKIEEFTTSIFFFDCIKENWTFRGWNYKGTKIIDENGNQLREFTISKEMTFVADYSQTSKLNIVKNIDVAGQVTGDGEYPYNTYVDISVSVNPGYEFLGWYIDDSLLSNNESYKYMLWNNDISIEARFCIRSFLLNIWSNNSTYGLVIYQNQNNNEYKESYQEYFDFSTPITIAAYSKTDVEFLGWYNSSNQLLENNLIYSFRMPSSDIDLEAKWNYFTITYNLYGGTNNNLNATYYTKDMSTIPLYEPTRNSYDFVGWKYGDDFINEINPSLIRNITLDAIWKAHEYTITYELNNGINDPHNPTSYTIENNIIQLYPASKHGYTFISWCSDLYLYNELENPFNAGYGDIVLYAKFIPTQYSITYILDGGINTGNNPSYYTIEEEFSFSDPSRKGYVFSGWYDESGNHVTSIQKGTTGPLVLTAHWSGLKNNLTVSSDDDNKGTIEIVSGTGYSGETVIVKASPTTGNGFIGWFKDGCVLVSENNSYSFKMPPNDYSLVARFLSNADKEQYEINNGIKPVISDDGWYITYGLYPQAFTANPSGQYAGCEIPDYIDGDVWFFFKNKYYARIVAKPYASGYTFINGRTITEGETYYFECQPIRWKILSNNGNYFVLSEKALDRHCFYGSLVNRTIHGLTIYPNNYDHSDIKQWLENDFYNHAFKLNDINVSSLALPESSVYKNTSYGFSQDEYSNKRYCKATDWALARGIYIWVQSAASPIYRNVQYMTSTRSKDSNNLNYDIESVIVQGAISGGQVNWAGFGVRPSCHIDI